MHRHHFIGLPVAEAQFQVLQGYKQISNTIIAAGANKFQILIFSHLGCIQLLFISLLEKKHISPNP
jgi:hypothetical protein